jgi:3-hydroxyisobutyrate dehydrogenase-like beta-hydroxyacid dehydrogenase
MSFSRVCLVGFGEVGQILAQDLAAKLANADIAAFDILFADESSLPSRALSAHRVRVGRDASEAACGAELIVSAVTAAQTVNAARSVTPGVEAGAFYLDLNSASPGAKRGAAAIINDAGARYVEAAVMTPYPSKRIASPMLLGGPHAKDFLERADAIGFSAEVFSQDYGKAAAAKLCRSVIIKGLEALLSESMLAARRNGVEDAVLASLGDLLPGADWPKLARHMISRSLLHGKRRAQEMREAARTVAEAGIEPLMSEAIARRQDWASGRDGVAEAELGALVDAMLRQMDAEDTLPVRKEEIGA